MKKSELKSIIKEFIEEKTPPRNLHIDHVYEVPNGAITVRDIYVTSFHLGKPQTIVRYNYTITNEKGKKITGSEENSLEAMKDLWK